MKVEHYAAVCTHCVVSHVGLHVPRNSCLDCERQSMTHLCSGFCVCGCECTQGIFSERGGAMCYSDTRYEDGHFKMYSESLCDSE